MKLILRLFVGLFLIQLAAAQDAQAFAPPGIPITTGNGAKAQPVPTVVDSEKLLALGYKPLFDGKTLDGWKKAGGTGQFKAEDQCIVGFGQNIRGNTFLRTEKSYADFTLIFEFQFVDPGGNSGCQFRSSQQEKDGRVFGYQCEHDSKKDRSYTAGIYDEARRGWLFPGKFTPEGFEEKFTAQGKRLFKWDAWNTVVIKCEGRHIQTWLNGEKRADFIDSDPKDFTPNGFIALQVHGGKSGHIQWRNLYLREVSKVK